MYSETVLVRSLGLKKKSHLSLGNVGQGYERGALLLGHGVWPAPWLPPTTEALCSHAKDQLSASISLIQPDPNSAKQQPSSGKAHLWDAVVPLQEWHVIKISLGTNLKKLCAESRDCKVPVGVLLFAKELDQTSGAEHENTTSAPHLAHHFRPGALGCPYLSSLNPLHQEAACWVTWGGRKGGWVEGSTLLFCV